jgi:thymidine phosphorylase
MEIGSLILQETGKAASETEAKEMLSAALSDGSALEKLRQMVIRQGGDVRLIDDTDLFEKAPLLTQVCASGDGYLESIDALVIGNLAMRAGAGRARKEDQIDFAAGILLKKKPGDRICAGDVLAEAYHRQPLSEEWMNECKAAFVIREEETNPVALIHSIL